MSRSLNYLKFIGIFTILELMITFVTSLLNLLGVNSGITSLILFVFNILLFFILNYYNASKIKKRGFLEGFILGLILITIMFIISLILFNNKLSIATLLYYIILTVISILGGMFGVNKKED